MIHVTDNHIFRGGQKIGFIQGNDIRSAEDHKLGFFEGSHIFDSSGRKIAWIEGDHIRTESGRNISLSDNHGRVTGSEMSDICRAAIRILLGD